MVVFVPNAGGVRRGFSLDAGLRRAAGLVGRRAQGARERTHFRGVVYADGVKVDWSIWPESLLERVAGADPLPGRPRRRLPRPARRGGPHRGLAAADVPRAHPDAAERRRVRRDRARVLVELDVRRERAPARRADAREVRARRRPEARRAPADARMAARARPRLVAQAGGPRTRARAAPPAGPVGGVRRDLRRRRASTRTGTPSSAPASCSAGSRATSGTRSATSTPRPPTHG